MMKRLMLLSTLFVMGCQTAPTFTEDQLLGAWESVEWKDVTNDRLIDVKVAFVFEEEGRYKASYGNATEKGKYWIVDGNLHTIEDGKAEKKVKIVKLENGTLVFEMNRSGNMEEITFSERKNR